MCTAARLFPVGGVLAGVGVEEWGEHFLQAGDEHVGFAGALGQLFDLRVLHVDLAAQKIVLAFEARDVASSRARTFASVRDCSRLFAAVRGCSPSVRPYFPRDERSRPFASGRD